MCDNAAALFPFGKIRWQIRFDNRSTAEIDAFSFSNRYREERDAIEAMARRAHMQQRDSDIGHHLPSTSEAEHSSSDTDSVSTPSESPIHR